MKNYWESTVLRQRLSRRRALAVAASSGVAAAILACGGGDEGGDGGEKVSGLLAQPVDTTAKAVKGGILKGYVQSDASSFDPHPGGSSQIFRESSHVYSRLLQYKIASTEKGATGELIGDAASSWELAPDRLSLTLKLKPNVKFDQRAPTNGRLLDSEDVVWSAKRVESISLSKGDIFNSADPNAAITSYSAIDKNTVKFNFAFPFSAVLSLFSHNWYLPILPREAESQFNPKTDMRGSGAWMRSKYEPSSVIEYQRNPNYYDADKVLFDGLTYPIITEAVQAQSQLKSKGIWYLTDNNFSIDVTPALKREAPGVNLYDAGNFTSRGTISQVLNFSNRETSPLRDARIRRAASMLIDRDAWIDVFTGADALRKEGFEGLTAWNNYIGASWGKPRWIDPKNEQKELGEGAANFQYNPDEAAKLLRAAGAFGMEHEFTYHTVRGGFGGVNYPKEVEVTIQMLSQGGHFKIKPNIQDYVSVITPKYTFSKGDFDGITFQPVAGYPDLDLLLWASFAPSGRNAWVAKPIPGVHELLQKHRQEFDEQKRIELVREMQRKLAVEMPFLPRFGIGQTFAFAWPFLSNFAPNNSTYPGGGNEHTELRTRMWYDASKDV